MTIASRPSVEQDSTSSRGGLAKSRSGIFLQIGMDDPKVREGFDRFEVPEIAPKLWRWQWPDILDRPSRSKLPKQ